MKITKNELEIALFQWGDIAARAATLFIFGGVEIVDLQLPDKETESFIPIRLARFALIPRYGRHVNLKEQSDEQRRVFREAMQNECYDLFRRHLIIVRPTLVS